MACSVDYSVQSQWGGGFVGSITLSNTGDAVTGWQLSFTFNDGQSVRQGWGGDWTTGSSPTVTSVPWNAPLATGGSATMGFIASWSGTNSVPTGFTMNGVACSGAGSDTVATTTTTVAPTTTTTTTSSRRGGGGGNATTTTTTTTTTSAAATSTATTTDSVTGTAPASYPNPGYITGSTGAHDPTVVKKPDGTYLVAVTGSGIPLKTSSDRTQFNSAGSAFPNGHSWTSAYTTGDLWAPDLSYHNGTYYLYYSASTFGSQNSAIFLATSSTGASGSWTNQGVVISSSSAVNYNAIDGDLIVDQSGRWWLSFGSFWSGIKMIELDPSTGKRISSSSTVYSLATRPSSVSGAVEAPDIYYHDGYYYLFASFDKCCSGTASTYRIMVGRSTSITGPYYDRSGVAMTSGGGTQILAGHGSYYGTGHSATLNDFDGDTLWYHYYASNGAPYLGINLLGWDSAGWPYVY